MTEEDWLIIKDALSQAIITTRSELDTLDAVDERYQRSDVQQRWIQLHMILNKLPL